MLKAIVPISIVITLLFITLVALVDTLKQTSQANILTTVINTRQAYISETAHFQLIDIERDLRIKIFPDVEELLDVELWSPQMGVLLTREVTPDAAVFRLYRYNVLTREQTLLHESSSPDRNLSFSILSDYTVQLSHKQDRAALYDPVAASLYVIHLETGASQQVLTFDQPISFPIILWSPDDSQIAFRQDYQTLTVIDLARCVSRTFRELAPHEVYPVWSSDSTQLLLSPGPTPAGAASTIRIIDAQTGETPPDVPLLEGRNPLWCGDDNRYLAFARQQDTRLEIINLETGENLIFPVPLNAGFSATMNPFPIGWKPDCSGLIFHMMIYNTWSMTPNYLYYADWASGETVLVSQQPVVFLEIKENGDLIVYERAFSASRNIQLYRLSGEDFQKTLIGEYHYSGDWMVWSDDYSIGLFAGETGSSGRLGLLYINSDQTHFLTGLYEFALDYRLWN